MNIFVLDNNPILAAKYHCDKHISRMCRETAQLLSISHHLYPHKNTWKNIKDNICEFTGDAEHKCVIWTCQSIYNYLWLLMLGEELYKEYTRRYHKVNRYFDVIKICKQYVPKLPLKPMTPFVLNIPDECRVRMSIENDVSMMLIGTDGELYTDIDNDATFDAVASYRKYYKIKKNSFAKWDRLSNVPAWFTES